MSQGNFFPSDKKEALAFAYVSQKSYDNVTDMAKDYQKAYDEVKEFFDSQPIKDTLSY